MAESWLAAKVVWIYNGQTFPTEMFDRPYAMCQSWKRRHSNDSQFAGGVLKVVSMTELEYKDM